MQGLAAGGGGGGRGRGGGRGGVLGADELHEVLLEAGAGEVGGVAAGRVPGHLLLHTGHLAQRACKHISVSIIGGNRGPLRFHNTREGPY